MTNVKLLVYFQYQVTVSRPKEWSCIPWWLRCYDEIKYLNKQTTFFLSTRHMNKS